MAKRQKFIQDSYFGILYEKNYSTSDNIISVQSPGTKQAAPLQVKLKRTLWKEQWTSQFQWLDYSASEVKSFVKSIGRKMGAQYMPRMGKKISR